jgi:hypothetical protein
MKPGAVLSAGCARAAVAGVLAPTLESPGNAVRRRGGHSARRPLSAQSDLERFDVVVQFVGAVEDVERLT